MHALFKGSGGGGTVNYQLYVDSAYTNAWGDGIRAAASMVHHAGARPDLVDRIESSVQQVLRQGLRTTDIYRPGTRLVGTLLVCTES